MNASQTYLIAFEEWEERQIYHRNPGKRNQSRCYKTTAYEA